MYIFIPLFYIQHEYNIDYYSVLIKYVLYRAFNQHCFLLFMSLIVKTYLLQLSTKEGTCITYILISYDFTHL